MPTRDQHERTLERFHQHQRAWEQNPALQSLYGEWYGRVRAALPPRALGPWWELGSGPGFARRFIPELSLSDLVAAPWHDRAIAADALPFGAGEIGALVLFDVLHHLPAPARFFAEATRVLAPGGRVVLCEPYVSPLSYPVYRFLHEEPLRMGVDPFAAAGPDAEQDPFDSNQAIPTLMFGRAAGRARFAELFPALALVSTERLAGPSYPASGGFSRRPLLPGRLWRWLFAAESKLPDRWFAAIGFRLLVVLEKH